MTTTLFNIIRSELIKKGYNEFIDDQGNLVIFDQEHQFMTKIFSYDQDVSIIVDHLFSGMKLQDPEHDKHFKRSFLYRFINRRINRQTVESFKMELLATFMNNESFINRVYQDLDKYVTLTSMNESENRQTNNQQVIGSSTADNRSAYAELPQNNVQIDVDNTIMESANDNTISRNKQVNSQETDGETIGNNASESKSYRIDELLKSNGILEPIYLKIDRKCFMQVW